MGLVDLLITPFYFFLFSVIAFIIRPSLTTPENRKYFLPALYLKLFGALALGLIFEFYYGYGGDTFNYYHQPGSVVSSSFLDSPVIWLKLVFANNTFRPELFQYTDRIFTYYDSPTYFIARIVGFFGVFTLNSYYGTALFFGFISFTGVWALYRTFYKLFPSLHWELAIACLFFPSLWFWGSGILKDTITFGALGWLIYATFELFYHRKFSAKNIIIALLAFYVIYSIKIYILLCLVPALLYWIIFNYTGNIKSVFIRVSVLPFAAVLMITGGYYLISKIGENSPRYSLESITTTAEETALWLEYVGQRDQGSVYSLGDPDFSPTGMARKFPLAVYTSLFRPHLWEVRNPVMLLSALESLFLIFMLIAVIWRIGLLRFISLVRSDALIGFCLIFSVIFAFAIGISTYNFGSLVRYRIPLIPFFLISMYLIRWKGIWLTNAQVTRQVT